MAEAHTELLVEVRSHGSPRGAHDLIIAATAKTSCSDVGRASERLACILHARREVQVVGRTRLEFWNEMEVEFLRSF